MSAEMIDGTHSELQRIAAAIKEYGFCLVKEEQLSRLFDGEDFRSKRFLLLANLAKEHEWSFEFHPHDGEVRIALLPSSKMSQSRNGTRPLAENTFPSEQGSIA